MPRDKSFDTLRMDKTRIPRDATAVTATQSQALKDGEVLADDGASYSTVQAAQDAASSWIRLPPETFNESVTIDTAGLSVVGSGYDTLVDGGTIGTAISITASNVTLLSLSVSTTAGAGNSYNGVNLVSSTSNTHIEDVHIRASDFNGILTNNASDVKIIDCYSSTTDDHNFYLNGPRTQIVGCKAMGTTASSGTCISAIGGDAVVANNYVESAGGDNIRVRDDNLVYGNRVHNAGEIGIEMIGVDDVCVNNRISGSGTSNIVDNGTNTLRDSNVTGPAN